PHCRMRSPANLQNDASCCTVLNAEIAVQLAEHCIAVLFRPVRQVRDEALDLFSGCIPESLGAAEVDGVGLHQTGIELVLANDLAESIADFRTTVASSDRLWRHLLRFTGRLQWGSRPNFLDRADTDTVGLA